MDCFLFGISVVMTEINKQSCAELFAYNNGDEWFVAHYLFSKK
jgi:hypothetical protein